jgi:hypothetical protein
MGLHAKTRFGFYTVSRDGGQVVSSKLASDLPLQWTNQGTRLVRFQWNATGTAIYLEAGRWYRLLAAQPLRSVCSV